MRSFNLFFLCDVAMTSVHLRSTPGFLQGQYHARTLVGFAVVIGYNDADVSANKLVFLNVAPGSVTLLFSLCFPI